MEPSLEVRDNPSSWALLLDLALPVLDHVFASDTAQEHHASADSPDWTLGGGTAIALRIAHRISDDIDLFVRAPIKLFSPGANPLAKRLSKKFQYPGHYVKYELENGEIDFLSPSLLTVPGYTMESFKGRSIALETLDEVITKKVRFRYARFTPRDIFDLAAVGRASSSIAITLADECADILPQLRGVIMQRITAGLRLESDVRAQDSFKGLLREAPNEAVVLVEKAIDLGAIKEALMAADILEPSQKTGKIRLQWPEDQKQLQDETLVLFDKHPKDAKTVLERALQQRSPVAFRAYVKRRTVTAIGYGD